MADRAAPGAVFNFFGLVMMIVFLAGLLLNGAMILIFKSIYHTSKTCTSVLIISISVCNLLHVLTYPLNVIASFRRSWEFGNTACELDAFWVHWMAITSVAHLTMLSMERFFTVSGKPFVKRKVYIRLVVPGCWFYGLFWSVLPLFGWSGYGLEGIGISCSAKFGSTRIEDVSYLVCVFITNFFLPIFIITFCYSVIYYRMRKHNSRVFDVTNSTSINESASEMEKSLISMVITMVAAFVFAWTPYAIVSFLLTTNAVNVHPIAATLPAIIAKSSACYFPVIYGFKHSAVQRKFRRFFDMFRSNSQTDVQPPTASKAN